jgi:hypothetical protein
MSQPVWYVYGGALFKQWNEMSINDLKSLSLQPRSD